MSSCCPRTHPYCFLTCKKDCADEDLSFWVGPVCRMGIFLKGDKKARALEIEIGRSQAEWQQKYDASHGMQKAERQRPRSRLFPLCVHIRKVSLQHLDFRIWFLLPTKFEVTYFGSHSYEMLSFPLRSIGEKWPLSAFRT